MTRKQKKHLARIIAAAVLLALVWFVLPLEGIWQLLAYCVPYFIVGWDVLWGAIRKILHGDLMDEEFLMSVATIGAFVLGDYREAVAVMLFYQIGEWFQGVAVGKTRRNITQLMDLRPDYANVVRNGQEEKVDPDEVEVGETIIVRPGEKIPLDGVILEGSTAVDTANSLIKNGYVAGRAKIGVTYNTITSYNNADAILSALTEKGFKNAKGTMVINQVSSDSDLAGKQVKQYDMIVAVNGKTMTSTDVMTQVLSDSKPGDTIKLTIARIENNQIKTFKVDCKLIENKGN